jgi:hypothetical protein
MARVYKITMVLVIITRNAHILCTIQYHRRLARWSWYEMAKLEYVSCLCSQP